VTDDHATARMSKADLSSSSGPNAHPVRIAAGCLALGAFTVAVIVGLWVDNPTDVILFRALLCMFFSYPIGLFAGTVCSRAIQAELQQYIESHPVPESNMSVEQLVNEMKQAQQTSENESVENEEN